MILHRLRLTNFRGVAHRDIAFPDHGVVVVCGPNEIGKSSMLEALDLLLTYKDRSTHRDVKTVKPTHADAGAEVEAEISTGGYRFVYRKRFHKKQMTELEILEPRREQLTADEAHERVEAILAETVDTRLWEAQRVLQSASTDAADLSGSDALSRALDAAAGAAEVSAAGEDSLLIDRIEAEYLRYFTATGRPAKEWKTAGEQLAAAEAGVAHCRARLAEVTERVVRHEQASATLHALADPLDIATRRLASAREAHAAVAEISEQLSQARLQAEAAEATAATAAQAGAQRIDLAGDAVRRAEELTEAKAALAAAESEEAGARQAAQRAGAARAEAEACMARDEADKLAARLQRIDDTERDLAQSATQLAAIGVTDGVLGDIEQASALVARLEAQLEADAGVVEFTATADLEVTVDGAPRTLAAGQVWEQPATAAVAVDLPGVLSVRIKPGATAVQLRSDLTAAQRVLQEALAQGGVADLASARAAAEQRRGLTAESGKLAAALDVLRGADDVEQLRAVLSGLREASAGASSRMSAADAEAARDAALAAEAALTEKSTRATILRERVHSAEAAVAEVQQKLAAARATIDDAAVAAQADAAATRLTAARATVAALADRCASAGADAVQAELTAATEAAEALTREYQSLSRELDVITIELGVMGSEGRQGELDDAEARAERARAEHTRLQGRAEAVALLRETMMRHRDTTRQRYVAPFRTELERLGRTVFGDTFEVEVDAELNICARTLDGCTVPYESLSGGAKEQLGILARLAGAALVAKEDTVPVVIDDALGFADPDRLVKMGSVLGTVGDRGQVIVLTCTPGRYDGIADAEVIELSA